MSISAGTFTFVADLVRRCSAIELPAGKEYLVESRLLPLVRQADLAGVDEYVATLRTVPHSAEHDRVVDALTTNETSWFRDFTPFQALTQHVVPTLAADHPDQRSLRVWSAACSTGQEPYSIAMALLDCAALPAFRSPPQTSPVRCSDAAGPAGTARSRSTAACRRQCWCGTSPERGPSGS